MAQPCKVYSYTNVETEKDVLANIRLAAQSGGWTVDRDAVESDGELYLHSAGNGGQRLFFSLRLEEARDMAGRLILCVHGNTGFDASAAWDAQPGRFTERIRVGGRDGLTGKPLWLNGTGGSSSASTGWWIVPPVPEQIVLVCPTFVLTAIRVVYTLKSFPERAYAGWLPLFFGAADGEGGELNTVRWSAWGANCAMGLMLSGLHVIPGNDSSLPLYNVNNHGTVGLLWNGANVDRLPPETTYGHAGNAASVVRTSVFSRPVVAGEAGFRHCMNGEVKGSGVTISFAYKGNVCASVPGYNAALLQNPGTLRHMLIKPLLYAADAQSVRIAGELPYYAVSLFGLKPKDRIAVGGRTFMVLPDIGDDDAIGLAVEVEA